MKVSILGVEFHSENRGCGALAYSNCVLLNRLAERKGGKIQATAFVVHENPQPILPEAPNVEIRCVKYRLKSPGFWREALRIMKESDWIIDYSLGDSFSDLYGKARFFKHSMLRECALVSGRPYIMGPQTYGPFEHRDSRILAGYFIRRSRLCFARDELSARYIKQICNREAILATDIAFALPGSTGRAGKKPGPMNIGINPSGLLWDSQKSIKASRKIKVDYRRYLNTVIGELAKDGTCKIYLIPHVYSAEGTGTEDDGRACRELHQEFPDTILAPLFDTPMEAKAYISRMDLFIGARMHATIAAVSSKVATIPFSYSRKFEGLFAGLNYPCVISAMEVETEEAINETLQWIRNAETLKRCAEASEEIAEKKLNVVVDQIERLGIC